MKTIYKFPIRNIIEILPENITIEEILTVQYQNDIPVLWAKVDTSKRATKTIAIYQIGTGWELDNRVPIKYINTLQDKEGYVWHFFYQEQQ